MRVKHHFPQALADNFTALEKPEALLKAQKARLPARFNRSRRGSGHIDLAIPSLFILVFASSVIPEYVWANSKKEVLGWIGNKKGQRGVC